MFTLVGKTLKTLIAEKSKSITGTLGRFNMTHNYKSRKNNDVP